MKESEITKLLSRSALATALDDEELAWVVQSGDVEEVASGTDAAIRLNRATDSKRASSLETSSSVDC